jgi:Flavin containing amine oxidoreductase
MVQRLATGLTIRTDWPVSRLCYDAHSAVLTGPDGARLRARKVVVTASLAVLQAGRIAFVPPLPEAKAGALRRLRMGNAAKVRRHVQQSIQACMPWLQHLHLRMY